VFLVISTVRLGGVTEIAQWGLTQLLPAASGLHQTAQISTNQLMCIVSMVWLIGPLDLSEFTPGVTRHR
jgi:hypothetical protein